MAKKIKLLITGANGYIGNCLFNFLKKKFDVFGIDCKNTFNKEILKCNLLSKKKLDKILLKIKPDVVIHLAAQSLVDETINKKKYYENNILASNILINLMKKNNIKKILFSSTASIYKKDIKPLKENSKLQPLSYYAKTKLICENNIKKEKKLKSIILRFFNVCSALNKPILGELHNPETHLIPTVVYKSLKKEKIYIYGKNFDTFDGTCVRDYIHIKDVCLAIEKSIRFLFKNKESLLLNIGNSRGYSNQEIVNFVEQKLNKKIDIKFVRKRKGDVSSLICNSDKARSLLSWRSGNSNIKNIIQNEISWIKKLDKMQIKRKFKTYL
ncbi:NAD-dependent epimerase/dehydratase family protein [Candidatus Pelagibacter sp.]|nr:NAD-dependent epimerase/dehydratase family protein [Candidatus Pelagibacter sp.]